MASSTENTLPYLTEDRADPVRSGGLVLPERYDDLGPLGKGGMGEVRRVRDRLLDRTIALKVLRLERAVDPAVDLRFRDEARLTARLQHPGIVPVYDLGNLPDGRTYYTMKEVEGRSLRDCLSEGPASGWTLRRLVDALARTCEAVAFAHAHGVLHLDLKPDNILIGSFGEVMVVDWGLAQRLGDARAQHLAGTPPFMAPERLAGAPDGPWTDVYALGAVLYCILAGVAPYYGHATWLVLELARQLPPTDVRAAAKAQHRPEPPDELASLVDRAMARDLEDRPANAARMGVELEAWLDGLRRKDRALECVGRAAEQARIASKLRVEADQLQQQAQALLKPVPSWAPAEAKIAGWAREDRASERRRAADLAEVAQVQELHAALSLVPDLADALDGLAAYDRAQLERAEATRSPDAVRWEALLRAHDRGQHARFLQGDGAVTLLTDPPGARVDLFRYVLRDRRLVPEPHGTLGITPLRAATLPRGSWLLEVHGPDRPPLRYPIFLGRQDHWDGIRPGETEPRPLRLPRRAELREDCPVPSGWFFAGGDPESNLSAPRRRLWLDGFFIRRFPVTNGEYRAFLDALVAAGREEEALACAPRERSARPGTVGPLIYGRDALGRFILQPDGEGDIWHDDDPVVMITWSGARAYAAWRAARDGLD